MIPPRLQTTSDIDYDVEVRNVPHLIDFDIVHSFINRNETVEGIV